MIRFQGNGSSQVTGPGNGAWEISVRRGGSYTASRRKVVRRRQVHQKIEGADQKQPTVSQSARRGGKRKRPLPCVAVERAIAIGKGVTPRRSSKARKVGLRGGVILK